MSSNADDEALTVAKRNLLNLLHGGPVRRGSLTAHRDESREAIREQALGQLVAEQRVEVEPGDERVRLSPTDADTEVSAT